MSESPRLIRLTYEEPRSCALQPGYEYRASSPEELDKAFNLFKKTSGGYDEVFDFKVEELDPEAAALGRVVVLGVLYFQEHGFPDNLGELLEPFFAGKK